MTFKNIFYLKRQITVWCDDSSFLDNLMYWVNNFYQSDCEDSEFITNIFVSFSNRFSSKKIIHIDEHIGFLGKDIYIYNYINEFDFLFNTVLIIRTIFKASLINSGFVNIHAGCIIYNNKGILISADRGQGKTTTILNSIVNYGFNFLANDQVIMPLNTSESIAYGSPALIMSRELPSNISEKISHLSLFEELDDLQEYRNKPRKVFLLNDLSKHLNFRVYSEINFNTIVLYSKSSSNSFYFTLEDINDSIWNSCLLELNVPKNLQTLLKKTLNYNYSLSRHNAPKLKIIKVTCGLGKQNDFFKFIKMYLNK